MGILTKAALLTACCAICRPQRTDAFLPSSATASESVPFLCCIPAPPPPTELAGKHCHLHKRTHFYYKWYYLTFKLEHVPV